MSGSTAPVFDPAALRRRTSGDPALQVEILALFTAEADRLLSEIESARDPQIRCDRVRAMRMLARNTGAMRLAEVAGALEPASAAGAPDLRPLREAVAEVIAYIQATGG